MIKVMKKLFKKIKSFTVIMTIFIFMTIASFGWLVWHLYSSYQLVTHVVKHDAQIIHLQKEITRLDQILTLLARVAATRGDPKYVEEYNQLADVLDTTITQAMALSPPEVRQAVDQKTQVANNKLVAMEKRAFELVQQGQKTEAINLLFGDEYEQQKVIYAQGLKTLTDYLAILMEQDAQEIEKTKIVALSVVTVVLIMVIVIIWGVIYIFRHQNRINRQLTDSYQQLETTQAQLQTANTELHQFKATLDMTLDCIFMFDAETLQFFYVNQGALNQIGYTQAELFQMTTIDIKPAMTKAQYQELVAPLINKQQPALTFQTTHQHKNSTLIPVEIFLQLIEIEEQSNHFVAIVRDITERKQTEAQLQQAQEAAEQAKLVAEQEYSRTLIKETLIGLVLVRMEQSTCIDGLIVETNPAFANMVGYQVDEMINHLNLWELTPKQYAQNETEQIHRLIATGQFGPYEKELIHKEGHLVPVKLSGLLIDKKGERLLWANIEDITEQKRSQALEHANRQILEELMRVFAAMSHGDLTQILTQNYSGSLAQLKTDVNATMNKLTHVMNVIKQAAEAASQGDFSQAINLTDKEGFFASLSDLLNQILAANQQMITELMHVFAAVASGDLTQTMRKDYMGTQEQLKNDVNATIIKLTEVINAVQQSAEVVAQAAEEIAQGNTHLSQRTEQQASSLEQTMASMEQMTSIVQQSADNAQQANQLAAGARDSANQGGQVVEDTIRSMTEISKSSQKVADIISVIDEIAFQTNLLALNAAVEAARAGEQGRGFAVVAIEVRNLAQRSASAAKEIKALIQDSVNKVEEGTRLVDQSGKTLKEIVAAAKKVSDIISEIAAAGREQSAGIQQINKVIIQFDEMTQQNAALVEEAAIASDTLKEQAQNLKDQVAFFKTGYEINLNTMNFQNKLTSSRPKTANCPISKTARQRPEDDNDWKDF
jgi:methyl-accepting chemotaxis protein